MRLTLTNSLANVSCSLARISISIIEALSPGPVTRARDGAYERCLRGIARVYGQTPFFLHVILRVIVFVEHLELWNSCFGLLWRMQLFLHPSALLEAEFSHSIFNLDLPHHPLHAHSPQYTSIRPVSLEMKNTNIVFDINSVINF